MRTIQKLLERYKDLEDVREINGSKIEMFSLGYFLFFSFFLLRFIVWCANTSRHNKEKKRETETRTEYLQFSEPLSHIIPALTNS